MFVMMVGSVHVDVFQGQDGCTASYVMDADLLTSFPVLLSSGKLHASDTCTLSDLHTVCNTLTPDKQQKVARALLTDHVLKVLPFATSELDSCRFAALHLDVHQALATMAKCGMLDIPRFKAAYESHVKNTVNALIRRANTVAQSFDNAAPASPVRQSTLRGWWKLVVCNRHRIATGNAARFHATIADPTLGLEPTATRVPQVARAATPAVHSRPPALAATFLLTPLSVPWSTLVVRLSIFHASRMLPLCIPRPHSVVAMLCRLTYTDIRALTIGPCSPRAYVPSPPSPQLSGNGESTRGRR